MPALTFVSSLSSVTSLSFSAQVPESVVLDASAPAKTGYGESKYVAERILNGASQQIPELTTRILRIGQIAGPIEYNSIWPAREWLPSLIISSKSIDALPSDLGRMDDIDWIPVDTLADCISEVVLSSTSSGAENESRCTVYNVVNPNVVSWQSLIATVKEQSGISRTERLRDWIDLVQEGPDIDQALRTSAETGSNPAKKILQFYQALQLSRQAGNGSIAPSATLENQSDGSAISVRPYELEHMAGASTTFRSLKPVSDAWLAKWIDGWL